MNNIWEFLVMTLTVSLAAGLILVLKALLSDKLTPRWQYGVWSLLALRMLIPVAVSNRYILVSVPLWIETLKALCESHLSSAYSQAFIPLESPWFPPMISSAPHSITDWLFVIYIVGVAISLLLCLVSYVKLRLLIAKAYPLSEVNQSSIDDVCNKYGLKPCPAVEIEGLPSAFVCGIIKPVLVLPAGTVTDEKIMLHELLHLKYKDALQSVIWAVFRALHWCNPFMHYVFNCIGNDMESLCDRRALELLEGEERRDYGKILLLMVNDRYPRAFGTTSLSNGGKNIAKRIACIAHFKKYPKGMALVSVCIGIMLLQPLFFGSEFHGVASSKGIGSSTNSMISLQKNMASARLNRCTTAAGAIDTYAKGLIYENGLYLAAASPLAEQKSIYDKMRRSRDEGWIYTHMENKLGGYPLARSPRTDLSVSEPYCVYNLKASSEATDSFDCHLVIYLSSVFDSEDETSAGIEIIPINIAKDSAGWSVTQMSSSRTEVIDPKYYGAVHVYIRKIVKPLTVYEGQGECGQIYAPVNVRYSTDNKVENQNTASLSWMMGNQWSYNETPITNTQFSEADMTFDVTYTFDDYRRIAADSPYVHTYITLENMTFEDGAEVPSLGRDLTGDDGGARFFSESAGSSSDGFSYLTDSINADTWDGTITDWNTGRSFYPKKNLFEIIKGGNLEILSLPYGLDSRVYIQGELVEQIISKEVTTDEQ